MGKLFGIIKKDGLLLLRDKMGLLILFILPMCLVLFISLTQKNIDETGKSLTVLLINQADTVISQQTTNALKKNDFFKVIEINNHNNNAISSAKKQVAQGNYRGLILIKKSIAKLQKPQNIHTKKKKPLRKTSPKITQLQLFLDPSMPPNISNGLKIAVNFILQAVQLKGTQKRLAKLSWQSPKQFNQPWFKVSSQFASLNSVTIRPNIVQQNVPAWTLFGMFFIVIPLAGQMVRERTDSIIQRLIIAPTSQLLLLLGRAIAFIILNLIQLGLMLLVGIYILPLFDLPSLNVANHVAPIFLVGLFASLAATGFGIFIGTWSKSYQQATTVGPFIIVIVAAVSGIFVPTYMMPEAMGYITAISPLHWAQSSFVDIFVRSASPVELLPNLLKLFSFFVAMLILSLPPFAKQSQLN